jgi:hypothetical protein
VRKCCIEAQSECAHRRFGPLVVEVVREKIPGDHDDGRMRGGALHRGNRRREQGRIGVAPIARGHRIGRGGIQVDVAHD